MAYFCGSDQRALLSRLMPMAARAPKTDRFFGDQLWHFFWEEELRTRHQTHSSRVGERPVQVAWTGLRKDVVCCSPHDPRRHRAAFEGGFHAGQRIRIQADSIRVR